MVFYCVMLAMFLNFSFGCMTYSSVHRTFSLMYRGLFESVSSTIDEDGEPSAYFNQDKVETKVKEYLDNNLPRYVKSYEVSYYYFYEENGLVCSSYNCTALKISLKANINSFIHYEKAMNYYISEGSLHE